MIFTGKYKEMEEKFRKDGVDEYMIWKAIRHEMKMDKFAGDEDAQARVGKSTRQRLQEWQESQMNQLDKELSPDSKKLFENF